MRVVVLERIAHLRVAEREDLVPAAGEVVIEVEHVGICGTDLHGFTGRNGRRQAGQVMGHEAAGRVAAIGPGVRELAIGDLVTFNPVIGCATCEACSTGQSQRCVDRSVVGVNPEVDGAYATHVVVPARVVIPLPPGMSTEHAALVEPVAVALHAVRRSGLLAGESILVLGGGPIGQSAVIAARSLGAGRILVSEPDPARRVLCAQLGATPIDPADGVVDAVRGSGGLVHRSVDAVGIGPSIRDAIAATAPGGTIVLVGMGAPVVELEPYPVTTEERSLVGSYCYSDSGFVDAVDLVATTPDIDVLISERVRIEDAPAMFDRLAATGDVAGKVLIAMTAP